MSALATVADEIELQIAELADASDAAKAAETMDKVKAFLELGRELKAKLDAAMVTYIKANGPITIGPVRWYVGVKKTTKCTDVGEAAKTMLELGGPDLLRDVLSSNAFKHGATRKRLDEIGSGEQYDRLFTVIEEEELKDGKASAKESLLSFDERFKR